MSNVNSGFNRLKRNNVNNAIALNKLMENHGWFKDGKDLPFQSRTMKTFIFLDGLPCGPSRRSLHQTTLVARESLKVYWMFGRALRGVGLIEGLLKELGTCTHSGTHFLMASCLVILIHVLCLP